jgi:hypothetical protein
MRIFFNVVSVLLLSSCSGISSNISPTSKPNNTSSTPTPQLSTSTSAAKPEIDITSSSRTGIVSDPSARNLADIASDWLKQPIDVEQEVESNYKYKSSSEFDRPKIKEQLTQSVKARVASMQNIGLIEFNINLNSPQYDLDNQVFYLEQLSPGQYFQMEDSYGEAPTPPIKIGIVNAEQFYRLSIPASEAKEMIEFNNKPSKARVKVRIDKIIPLSPGLKIETSLKRLLIYDKKGSVLADKSL